MSTPVTIGDLRRDGQVLEAHCNVCAHFAELDAVVLPFDDSQPVPTASVRMRCSRCRSRSIHTRPQTYVETIAEHRARIAEEQRIGTGTRY